MTNISDIEDHQFNHLFLHERMDNNKDKEEAYLIDLINNINDNTTDKEYKKLVFAMRKKHKVVPGVIILNYLYKKCIQNKTIKSNKHFEKFNIRNETRATSGITQITVLTSPRPNGQDFTCEHNCYYCPNEPAHEENNWTPQPRSYLFNEPAVRRANENKFDAAWQVWHRASALELCGLPVDKVELYILGGTWGSYPIDYRIEFVRDLYYAANTYYHDKTEQCSNMRPRLSLEEEIEINQTTDVRIIGLTMETRPDHVTADEIKLLRRMNCTRVQIGVQHLDYEILKKINRGCYYDDVKRGCYNLLNCGFKVEIHLMFDLPNASPDKDKALINQIFRIEENGEYNFADPNITFDEAKYYPFQSVDWTVTKQWEDKGEYLHYSHEDLIDVLIYAKSHTPPSIRLARVIRDIPVSYVYAGNNVPNLRQLLEEDMKKKNLVCKCIRCREVRNKKTDINNTIMNIREYDASGGHEYFISIESPDKEIIYGFCRLRLSPNMGIIKSGGYSRDNSRDNSKDNSDKDEDVNLFPFLNNVAVVRELHVYGNMTPHKSKKNDSQANSPRESYQHRGFGKMLLKEAERIAVNNNYHTIAVISGVGVRKYYEKCGYALNNNYMMKDLDFYDDIDKAAWFISIILIIYCVGNALFCMCYL
jgi:ELP3 family radical SAM enzyme/protein acetyltransferase